MSAAGGLGRGVGKQPAAGAALRFAQVPRRAHSCACRGRLASALREPCTLLKPLREGKLVDREGASERAREGGRACFLFRETRDRSSSLFFKQEEKSEGEGREEEEGEEEVKREWFIGTVCDAALTQPCF